MNFEEDEDDPLVYKNLEMRTTVEDDLNDIVLTNLQISDTTDEPSRISSDDIGASSTSLFSSTNLTASSSRENKPDKKDDKPEENVGAMLESDSLSNLAAKLKIDENGNETDDKTNRPKLKSDSQLINEECSAAQGDGHQFATNRDEVALNQINKNASVTCGERANTLEKIILDEGDCGTRKIATSSGSRPEMSENAWKRASASTSNCGRPATVPKARPRRSETASVMTNTERDARELKNQIKSSKGDDDDDSDSDNSWWEDHGKSGHPVPKPRTLGDKKLNVDITRQRSILDLCSVEHGETVQNQPDNSEIDRKSDLDGGGGQGENLESLSSHGELVGELIVSGECEAAASVMNLAGNVGECENNQEILFDHLADDVGGEWDWVNEAPRACVREEIDECDVYSPILMNLSDGDLDPRLLKQRLQVTRNDLG